MFNFEDVRDSSALVPDPSGRTTGITFTAMKRNEDKSVSFIFEKKATGEALNHRVFIPTRFDGNTDEEFKKSVVLNVQGLAHILRAFCTEAEFKTVKVENPNDLTKVEANWISITSQMAKILKPKLELPDFDNSCDLKAVYGEQKGKWYVGLPKVPPFISTKNHPKNFIHNPQYDFYTIPNTVPDKEISAQGGSGASESAAGAPAGAPAPTVSAGNNDF